MSGFVVEDWKFLVSTQNALSKPEHVSGAERAKKPLHAPA